MKKERIVEFTPYSIEVDAQGRDIRGVTYARYTHLIVVTLDLNDMTFDEMKERILDCIPDSSILGYLRDRRIKYCFNLDKESFEKVGSDKIRFIIRYDGTVDKTRRNGKVVNEKMMFYTFFGHLLFDILNVTEADKKDIEDAIKDLDIKFYAFRKND